MIFEKNIRIIYLLNTRALSIMVATKSQSSPLALFATIYHACPLSLYFLFYVSLILSSQDCMSPSSSQQQSTVEFFNTGLLVLMLVYFCHSLQMS